MDDQKIVDRIAEIARTSDPDELLETTAATLHAELYDDACEAFGGWDAALASALCRAVQAEDGSRSDEEASAVERVVGPDAKHPVYVCTDRNAVLEIEPGTNLRLSQAPEHLDLPKEAGEVVGVHHVGQPEGLVWFSTRGRYFALDPGMVPNWRGDETTRRVGDMLDVADDEVLRFVVPRRMFYGGRIVHVTAGAKGKATDASDFQYALDHEPRIAFELDDGDRPVAVFSVPEETGIFAASAHGRGIHFPDSELRSMGQRAVGVKIMDLDDGDDAVVGAFRAERVDQVAVVTERGLGKRVEFSEFRQQGRAGAGMQLARLNREDRIAGVAPCRPSDDIVVRLSDGRLWRRPVADFPAMGRPAKGNSVVDVGGGVEVADLYRLPCGGAGA